MPSHHLRFAWPLATLTLLIACGGGGGGSTSASPSTHPTSLTFQATGGTPDWVAYQDGNGAWTAATLASGSVTLPIHDPSGKYGLAIGYTSGTNKNIQIWQATLSERPTLAFRFAPAPITLTANAVSGLTADQLAIPSFGPFLSWPTTNPGGTFVLTCYPGTSDLVAVISDSSFNPQGTWSLRNQTFNADTSLPALDLSSYAPAPQIPVTLLGSAAGKTTYLFSDWFTSGGTDAQLAGFEVSSNPDLPSPVGTVASSQLASGDIQYVEGYETDANTMRVATSFFKTATSLSMTLPPSFNGSMAFDAAAGQVKATWTPVANSLYYSGRLTQPGIAETVYLSSGWAGTSGTLSYAAPNLQAIAPGWVFTTGSGDWRMFAYGGSRSWKELQAATQPYKDGDKDWLTGTKGSLVLSAAQKHSDSPSAESAADGPMSLEEARQFVRTLRANHP